MFDLDHGEPARAGQALKGHERTKKDHLMRLLMMLIPYAALAGLATCAPAPVPSAAKVFAQNCTSCHGIDGRGDGPEAARLPRAPADLTQIAVRNGGEFPTAGVMATIHGYQGKGVHALMPEFGDVLNSPTILWADESGQDVPTPEALLELALFLEGLQID